jgi:hypothetical protein
MASAKALARLEALVWTLIYGGLFAVILGFVAGDVHIVAGWSLGVMGGIAVAAGVVLIWVRSRMSLTPPEGTQSEQQSQGST